MSRETERSLIETRWKSMWTKDGSAVELTKTIYEGFTGKPPTEDAWVRMTRRHGDGLQASMGNPSSNWHRFPAVLYLEIFIPLGEGSKRLDFLGYKAEGIFTAARLGDGVITSVKFGTASFTIREPDSNFLSGVVKAPFYRDELK